MLMWAKNDSLISEKEAGQNSTFILTEGSQGAICQSSSDMK